LIYFKKEMLDTKNYSEKREYFIYFKKEILYTEKYLKHLKNNLLFLKIIAIFVLY
tara:strand:+ start:392 stop:556 length:165 start_codon:yes stop_codon:yes gene_type:complete